MSYGGGKWGINASCVDERHLLDNQIRRIGQGGRNSDYMHKGESDLFKIWIRRVQDVAAERLRPDLVALGLVVITFHHKPQWRHKGPGAQGGFYIYNHRF